MRDFTESSGLSFIHVVTEPGWRHEVKYTVLRLICMFWHPYGHPPKVVYNNAVVVVGTPLLTLRVGDAPYYNRRAVYSSGSGTSTLEFEYIVQVRASTTLKH